MARNISILKVDRHVVPRGQALAESPACGRQAQQLEPLMDRVRHRSDLADDACQFLADIGDDSLHLAVMRRALQGMQPQRERHHPLADVLVQRLGQRCALPFVRLYEVAAQI
jgi:hypothetical protein